MTKRTKEDGKFVKEETKRRIEMEEREGSGWGREGRGKTIPRKGHQ